MALSFSFPLAHSPFLRLFRLLDYSFLFYEAQRSGKLPKNQRVTWVKLNTRERRRQKLQKTRLWKTGHQHGSKRLGRTGEPKMNNS